jgi:hypothetical protein
MLPCGFAAGIAGALPKAGVSELPRCLTRTVASPINATIRPNGPEKSIALPSLVGAEAS